MQNVALDILVLGLFVVLFGSIYAKRASGRLRFWVAAWLLILLHFAAQLVHPGSPLFQNLDQSLSLGALMLAGICFLLSSSGIAENPCRCVLVASCIGIPALFYTNYLIFDGVRLWPLSMAAAVGAVGGTALAWNFFPRRRKLPVLMTGIFIAAEFWVFYEIFHHRPEEGILALLSEIFLVFAALYWFDFRRFSAGVLTTTCGLVAWAAVFPVGLLCHYLIPAVAIPSGLWNVPKYFVAFGMILTLLEDEIYAAGKASEHYRLLFSANPHPMWIHDPETLRFLRVNDAAVAQYGYSREEFMSMTVHDLRPGENFEAILQEMARSDSFTLAGPWKHRRKDGSEMQAEIAAHVIDFQGRNCRFVLVNDVTERQRLHQQLVHQAHHDSLTGLPNRLLLADRMQQTFAHVARHSQRAAVICIDLDRFKQINDTYGHVVGDHCLQQIAARLSSRVRAVDTVARTGGEEFIVVLGELGGRRDSEVVGQDLLQCILEPIECGEQVFRVSASLGIAVYPDDGTGSSELWRAADSAMYRAKYRGGGQYCFASSAAASTLAEAQELEDSLRQLVKNGGAGLELYFQPVYSMATRLCSLEALLRLNHPRLGMVSPERLIPIAEECGLAVQLGEAILEEVCRQSVEWQRQGLKPIRIALNISSRQFMRTDFSAQVYHILSRHGLDPLLLEFQVTETMVMSNHVEVGRQMRSLAALGIHFSVDNFGTGYSSLNRLHQLPISTLKINRSLIERISAVHGTYSIVQAIIALGHSLGLQVLAEGVERSDQLEALRRLTCDFLQGYLLSPPMPASHVARHLAPVLQPMSQGLRSTKRVSYGSSVR